MWSHNYHQNILSIISRPFLDSHFFDMWAYLLVLPKGLHIVLSYSLQQCHKCCLSGTFITSQAERDLLFTWWRALEINKTAFTTGSAFQVIYICMYLLAMTHFLQLFDSLTCFACLQYFSYTDDTESFFFQLNLHTFVGFLLYIEYA